MLLAGQSEDVYPRDAKEEKSEADRVRDNIASFSLDRLARL